MQCWKRIILDWTRSMKTMGFETTVPMAKSDKGICHKLYGVRAVSLPERRAKIEVDLRPFLNFNHTDGDYILALFKDLGKGLRHDDTIVFSMASWGTTTWPPVVIEFELHNGERFCNTVIKLVAEIFERLGLEKDHADYRLADFTLRQADFVKFEGAWISFVRWLRIENQLPAVCLFDDENIELAEAA